MITAIVIYLLGCISILSTIVYEDNKYRWKNWQSADKWGILFSWIAVFGILLTRSKWFNNFMEWVKKKINSK